MALTVGCQSEATPETDSPQPLQAGRWKAVLDSPGGDLRFDLWLTHDDGWKARIGNGPEEIEIPKVTVSEHKVALEFPHYDSRIEADIQQQGRWLEGQWRKRRSGDQWTQLGFRAEPWVDTPPNSNGAEPWLGKWRVDFSSDEQPAVAHFQLDDNRQLWATFLTTVGDYRYLAGRTGGDLLSLSCFDGAHAFLFKAHRQPDGSLKGDFWSSDNWHETWTAKRDDNAALPDAFELTRWNEQLDLAELAYPDLDGQMVSLADKRFQGRARMIYVFGSWCPNCHDAAQLMSQLHAQYGDRGLSILGLAFEHTGDAERDAQQVRRYAERHGATYPILIGGRSDKAQASAALPILDRVRAYPTLIFLDRSDTVRAVYTGFSGPATGAAHDDLKKQFRTLIEGMLGSSEPD